MAKGFAVAGAAAAGGLAVGLKKSADAAIEAEKAQATMVAQLKASGISYQAHAKEIDRVIQKHSQLSGLDDEDLQRSFTNIVRVTGDVDKSLRLTGLAADFARAKHMDVAKAGELVGKVAGGNTGILSRYGITIDKGASATEALGVLQQKFAGQAAAYGKTTAGALDRSAVASENLGEIVGAKLTPLLAKGATALVNLVDKAGQLGGPIRKASGAVRDAYESMMGAVRRFVNRNRSDIDSVIGAARNLGKAMKYWFEEVTLPVIKTVATAIGRVLGNIVQILRGVVRVVSGILTGDWRKAWQGAKDIAAGAVKGVFNILRGAAEILLRLALVLGKQIIKGLVAGLRGIGTAVFNGIKSGINAAIGRIGDWLDKANPLSSITGNIGDGIGRVLGKKAGDGLGFMGGSAGGSGAGLMGADFDLAPFARIGAGMGLRVSSGLRPGSVTSSGNTSYHSSGDAIDMAGPPSAMGRFFQTMRGMFGSKLRELIYTPGGTGVKDGRPYTYSGQVAQDHYDHVHVAYTGPFGDGVGRAAGKPPPIGDKTMGWMQSVWGRIAPMLGQDPATKVRDLFKYTEGKGLFVGVDAINLKKGEFGLMWPKWLGKPDKALTQLFIHEMAHRFQKPGATGSYRLAEGGAEAFARRVMAAQFGGPVPSTTYAGIADWVTKHKGENWINYGQFGRKPGTGDGLGFSEIERYWIRGGGSRKMAPLMAHIAMAESRGDTNARNPSGASGLWQILGQEVPGNIFDPLVNAQNAVWKLRHEGLGAWDASRGVWGRYAGQTGSTSIGGSGGGGGAPHGHSGPAEAFRQSQENASLQQGVALRTARRRGGGKWVMGPRGIPVLRGAGSGPLKTGDVSDLSGGGEVEAVSDPAAEALTAAIEASTRATEAHTTALGEVGAQMKRQTDLAQQYASTSEFQKTKFLADIFSGQFGRGIIGRGFTAGTGVEVAYRLSIFQVA